ncbi:UDP-glucose 4-epimerase [hydrothermal vent metagenome]|uniref:UDP-glucose 4-epimerase n=1 Tax=hydrothermal vent metagenome TaxID=652676 RepID=A0A3B0YRT2_9ZZZZ
MKTKESVLITGGAGYIGSHVVRQLGEANIKVVTLDNLCTGFKNAVTHGELILGDTGDQKLVTRIIKEHKITSVLHFAAHTIVPESVSNPLKYYGNNTCQSRNLLQCCAENGVKNFIFSSTAAVYGTPDETTVSESAATAPINAYGTSKLMTEWMLRDLAAASELNYVVLRYFNVAGSDPQARIGQSTKKATLLIKVACEIALGIRDHLSIFGTDYPTPDGTGVRDYIHVEDLASAHIAALNYLQNSGTSTTLNCGYGHGYSVREVINAVEKVHGKPLKVIEKERRAGDPALLVANTELIHQTLDWQPEHNNLETIVRHALAWEKKLMTNPMK